MTEQERLLVADTIVTMSMNFCEAELGMYDNERLEMTYKLSLNPDNENIVNVEFEFIEQRKDREIWMDSHLFGYEDDVKVGVANDFIDVTKPISSYNRLAKLFDEIWQDYKEY